MIHDYFCVSFNTQPMNLRRKRTGQRRKSLSKIEPFQGRKQWKGQTTRLNGQKTKQKPWKRMRLAKAMKTMMTEKTRKRDEGYESLEDSSAVSKEFWGLVFVQCKEVQRYFRRKSSVQLDALQWNIRWPREWRSPAQSIPEVEPVLKATNLWLVTEAENTWPSSFENYGILS